MGLICIFVTMAKLLTSFSFLFVLLNLPGVTKAQFSNRLENQKQKPVITKAQFSDDSAHYKAPPQTAIDTVHKLTHWVWSEFDKFKSTRPTDSNFVVYARGNLNEKSWSTSRKISKFHGDCSNGDGSLRPDAPQIGLNGEVYVCWASPKGLAFQRSLDSGLTWLSEEKIIAPIVNGWSQQVDSVIVDSSPKMAIDKSGIYKGRIYIIWGDEKNGVKDKDLFLTYSDDNGENWLDPMLLTYRGNHKEQFEPTIDVEPGTGKLYITFLDKQNYMDESLTDLYLGISSNGGLKFYFYKVNQEPIVLDKFITSVKGLSFEPDEKTTRIVWSQITQSNFLNIYSVNVSDTALAGYSKRYMENQIELQRTIDFSDKMKIPFVSKNDMNISAVITKPLEPKFNLVVARDLFYNKGANELEIDLWKLGLKKDNYILTIYYEGRNNFIWILK